MTVIRYLFAGILLTLALPAWRAADWAIIFWPEQYLFGGLIVLWFNLFILLPVFVIFPRIPKPLLLILFALSFIPLALDPLSKMATTNPEFNHCGQASFTGTLYPLKHLVPYVQEYDLEIRNQLCWIRKMIRNVPEKFESAHELETYSELMKKKLMMPERKYKVSVIGIFFLWSRMTGAWQPDGTIDTLKNKQQFVNGMIDWYGMYEFEVGDIEFKWYDWPYSEFLKLEYGWVENNITLRSLP